MRIDLHRHLEGSHSPRALLEVAQRFDLRRAPFFDPARNAFVSLEELTSKLVLTAPSDDANLFYQCIIQARAAYQHLDAIETLAELAFVEAAAEADAFEMRASLFSMTRTLLENQGRDWRAVPPPEFAETHARAVLLRVLRARQRAEASTGKRILIRIGLSRTFESEPHYRALVPVLREHARELVGLDVLGIVIGPDREPMPPALLEILRALRPDLPDLTIHAGEFEGAASVDRTMLLEPQAIGHGVHAIQSRETMDRLAKEGLTLEVCPSSNRLLIPSALARLEALHGCTPLVALQRHGVHTVLGSDDPVPFGTTFDRELEHARGLGVDMARLEADTLRRWKQLQP